MPRFVYDPIATGVAAAMSSDRPVVLIGEGGVGKCEMAAAIHRGSDRARGPLHRIVCADRPHTLVASEIVGHRAGGFAGALRDKRGGVWQADGGSLILSGLPELSPSSRIPVAHLIQTGEVVPLGAAEPEGRADVRIIITAEGASSTSVRSVFTTGDVIEIQIRPLRDRRSDIVAIASACLQELRMTGDVPELSQAAAARLLQYEWPGNLRELEAVMAYAEAHCSSGVITLDDLPPHLAA